MSNEINNLKGFDKFVVDTDKKVLWCEDKVVKLPFKAIEVLCALVENKGEVVSKDDLLDKIWKDSFVEEGILSQNVYRLRKAFKKYGNGSDLIQTIPGRGYRFSGNISEIVEEEISIERSTYEKKFIAEGFISDEEYAQASGNRAGNISAEIDSNQLPSNTSKSFLHSKSLTYLAIILLSFSVIGAGFWFWKSPNSNRQTFALVKDNVEFTRITDSGKAFFPAISRDNQHIAYIRNEKNTYSIILQHIATKSETVIVEPKEYGIMSLEFSADGYYLFYITREKENLESTIYQIPIYGGARRKITTNVRHYFSLSPDGEKLAFFRYEPKNDETHLITCKTDGSGEEIIATRKHPHLFRVWGTYPAWSPDGKKFLVAGVTQPKDEKDGERKSYFLEIDIKTGEEKIIEQPVWKSAFQAFWLRDGSGLIVSAQGKLENNRQLWHLSYPEGKVSRITNDTNFYDDFKLTFDTESIVTSNISHFYNLYTVSLNETYRSNQITKQNLASYGLWGMDWTSDGKWLVYVKSDGHLDGNLWKMNLETLEDVQLTFDKNFEDRYPNITPDGKSVIFSSNRLGKRHIWQVDLDGKNLRQITDTIEGANYPEISKDGKWLIYNTPGTGPLELWKKTLSGGKPEKILHNAGGVSNVSPIDSDQIIAHYFDPDEKKKPWKYVLFSHESNGALRHLNIDPEKHSFEWNIDGTGVYYPNKSLNQNNLWFLSINENTAKQVTNFEDQKIVNLSISPNGKTMALSRGTRTGNILKINGFRQY